MKWESKQKLRNDLASAQLRIRLLAERLGHLTNSDPYKSGLHDGVTVGIQQLFLWLADSRESANQMLSAMPMDNASDDFKRGHDIAAAWIDESINQLFEELEGRAHVVAAGQQETPRPEGS